MEHSVMTAARGQAGAPALETARPDAVGLSSDRLALIGRALEREVGDGRLPGAVVGIARRGRVAYLEAFGHADPVSKTRMPKNAIFSIASMTKPMVSVAVLQLFEQARLLLGDPVSRYLPELADLAVAAPGKDGELETRPAKRNPTIQDLLRHTSGWSYQERGTSPACRRYPGSSISASIKLTKGEFLAALAAAPLLFEPGSDWEYGFSTDVLGLVLEAIDGRTLGEILQQRIWSPLGMTDTGFTLSASDAGRYARAFEKDPATGERQPAVHHTRPVPLKWESGGGGALSTAEDYLRFALMLLGRGTLGGRRILGPSTVTFMTADHLAPQVPNRISDTMDPAAAGYGFGLGVAVRRQAGISALAGSAGDFYWSGVYGTYFWADPAQDMACVLMVAAPGQSRLRYRQMLRALVYQAIES
jgi:CubicO group peptidase (beta-lactamase class C family)